MQNLSGVVQQLRKERDRAKAEMDRLNAALKVLGGWAGSGKTPASRRSMSAKARKRIADAQRARWAKWRAAKKK